MTISDAVLTQMITELKDTSHYRRGELRDSTHSASCECNLVAALEELQAWRGCGLSICLTADGREE